MILFFITWFLAGFCINMFIGYRFMHQNERRIDGDDVIFSVVLSIMGLLNIPVLIVFYIAETNICKNLTNKQT